MFDFRQPRILRNRSLDVPASLTMVQQALADRGYTTIGVTENGYVSASLGFDRGFTNFFDGAVGMKGGISKLMELLAKYSESDDPIFAFYHTYEIHSPYTPPEEYQTIFGQFESDFVPTNDNLKDFTDRASELSDADLAFLNAMYDGGIRYADDLLRQFFASLEEIGFLDQCLVIITSDHGEEFGDHGGLLHKRTLYDELLRVPLILVGEGVSVGKVDERMASSVARISVLALARPQYTSAPARMPRLFALNPAHPLRR